MGSICHSLKETRQLKQGPSSNCVWGVCVESSHVVCDFHSSASVRSLRCCSLETRVIGCSHGSLFLVISLRWTLESVMFVGHGTRHESPGETTLLCERHFLRCEGIRSLGVRARHSLAARRRTGPAAERFIHTTCQAPLQRPPPQQPYVSDD